MKLCAGSQGKLHPGSRMGCAIIEETECWTHRLAVAPVATIRLCALTVVSVPLITKGRCERSTDSTSSVRSSAPHRSACIATADGITACRWVLQAEAPQG